MDSDSGNPEMVGGKISPKVLETLSQLFGRRIHLEEIGQEDFEAKSQFSRGSPRVSDRRTGVPTLNSGFDGAGQMNMDEPSSILCFTKEAFRVSQTVFLIDPLFRKVEKRQSPQGIRIGNAISDPPIEVTSIFEVFSGERASV